MKRILSLLLILITWSLSDAYAQEGMQLLHVDGNQFKTSDGNSVILRGLCMSDPVKLVRGQHWTPGYFAAAKEYGANVVRFAVHPENINSMGWEATFQTIDEGVHWAKEQGMYVIIDWHSIGNLKDERFYRKMYVTTLEETLKFWKTVAQRYKEEPTVALYELFNEPTVTGDMDFGSCTWDEWREIQEQMIDTIRTYNPEAICLCAGHNWAYDLTSVAKKPIRRENVAYVSHPYPQKREQPWEEQWEKDFGYVADTYPVICTEIGYCLPEEKGAHIPVKSDDTYGEHITRYFEQKGISFTIWCFDADWPPMVISDWNYTLTTQGRFFKHYLQGR